MRHTRHSEDHPQPQPQPHPKSNTNTEGAQGGAWTELSTTVLEGAQGGRAQGHPCYSPSWPDSPKGEIKLPVDEKRPNTGKARRPEEK